MIKEIRNPDLYHGGRKKGRFFEGWYFKITDREKKHVLAFIPGIYKDNSADMSHGFIQVLNGNECSYRYISYKAEDFRWKKEELWLAIGNSTFSLNKIHLDIYGEGISARGDISLSCIFKWRDSLINPGSMGFYNYFTFMECYSQVCALDGRIDGKLEVNGEIIDFDGGRIYIEKNWGRSFPKYWIWVQCNSFCKAEAALTCSTGRVPFMFGSFDGFLVGFRLGDNFYSFTSMNKSVMEADKKGEDVKLLFSNHDYTLSIETESRKDRYVTCMGPSTRGMIPLVDECLTAKVYAELKSVGSGEVIFKDEGHCTGIEYGGHWMF